jgi:hypothetical protein
MVITRKFAKLVFYVFPYTFFYLFFLFSFLLFLCLHVIFSCVYLVCFALLRVISSKMCQSILLCWEREVAPKAESGEPRPKMWTSWTVTASPMRDRTRTCWRRGTGDRGRNQVGCSL